MKKINVKLLFTALLSTAFSLTAGAQDFEGEAVVTKETDWGFGNFERTGNLTNWNSLYVRGSAPRKQNTTSRIYFPDGTEINASGTQTQSLYLEEDMTGEENITSTTTAASSANISNCIALNVDVPGTLYIYARVPSTNDEAEKVSFELSLYFNGEKVFSQEGKRSASNQYFQISQFQTNKGTYFFGGNVVFNVMGVRFVPERFVSATSLWKFNQFDATTIISGDVDKSSTGSVIDFDGLYIHNRDDKDLVIASQSSTYTFNDTEIALPKPMKRMAIQSIGTVGSDKAAFKKALGALALQTTVPGKLYFATQHINSVTQENPRYFELYKDGTKVVNQSYTPGKNNHTTVSYTTDEGGTFYLKASTGTLYVVGVLFVPTTAIPMIREVTLSDTGYATFSASQNYSLPEGEGLTAYVVSSFDKVNNKITMVSTDVIPACEGVVLKGTPNTTYTLTSTEEMGSVAKNLLVANLAEWNLSTISGDDTQFILVKDGETNNVLFGKVNGTSKLAANRAFLRIPTGDLPVGARELSITFNDGETTGIVNANLNANLNVNESYYNLAGQRVAQPTKGLYIVNGKKYIVK